MLRHLAIFALVLALPIVLPTAAQAESVAVLVLDAGGSTPSPTFLDEIAGALRQRSLTVITAQMGRESLRSRYTVPEQVDIAGLREAVVAGEDAYFELRFEEGHEFLGSPVVAEAIDSLAAQAANPEVADLALRALMTRARIEFSREDEPGTVRYLRQALQIAPHWIARTDTYQPNFVRAHRDLQSEILLDAVPITLELPDPECEALINGRPAPTQDLTVPNGEYVFQLDCPAGRSQLQRIDVSEPVTLRFYPVLEAALGGDLGAAWVTPNDADDFEVLGGIAGEFMDMQGVDAVLVAAEFDDERQLVLVERDGQITASRGGPSASANDLVAVLYGADHPHIAANRGSGWQSHESGFPSGVVGWSAIGVGGALVITGVVLGIAEGGTFDDFEQCRQDESCALSSELADLQNRGERQSTAATATIVSGAAVAIGGLLVLLLVDDGDEDPSDSTAAWVPQPSVSASASEGALWLHWRF
ncbi:MAG: hypothetical protein KC561_02215 [Myxococcales bacterium]|nr:hypothetical protein [Myxococcales bacterium]